MDFEGMKNVQFFISLGYVTILASILTMICMELIKKILKKKKIIYIGIDPNEKDAILSRYGRIVAIVLYSVLYIGNELFVHHRIAFDGTLMTGLLSGGTLTLTLAKGLYTSLRQYAKKRNVFEKLKVAEATIHELNVIAADIVSLETMQASDETLEKAGTKWILTSKKDK